MFSDCTVPPDNKKMELGSSNQEASPSASKNNSIVLVPCPTRKCVLTAISGGVDISKVPQCHLLQQMSSQLGSQKLPFCFQPIIISMNYGHIIKRITLSHTTL